MRTIGDSIPGVVSLLRQRVSIGDVLPLPFRSTNTVDMLIVHKNAY